MTVTKDNDRTQNQDLVPVACSYDWLFVWALITLKHANGTGKDQILKLLAAPLDD